LEIFVASDGTYIAFQRGQIRHFLLENQIRCAERCEVAAEDAHVLSPSLAD
jgi:hypothetical protein